jgi:hypothetical protein
MKRRDFITLLGGTAAAWPLAARAQQTRAMRRVGVLMAIAESDPEGQARVRAFHQAMNDLGGPTAEMCGSIFVGLPVMPIAFEPTRQSWLASGLT